MLIGHVSHHPVLPLTGLNLRRRCRQQQRNCLEWVDKELAPLLRRFIDQTTLICADHGDCWGENGLWEHGISHWATLTVPLIMRVKGKQLLLRPRDRILTLKPLVCWLQPISYFFFK